jgi:UPF0042 nucleotide-binding protein
MEVVIITGMSGAGRSRAADWFEDQGYYCVDNMPPALMNSFLSMASSSENNIEKVVFVADLRSGNFFGELVDVIDELRERSDIELTVLYMEASVSDIVRRYNEVRRNHPLTGGQASASVIEDEEEKLRDIRMKADLVLDTSNLKLPEMVAELDRMFFGGSASSTFSLNISSFGFKYGIPTESDVMFDVRFLPNPFYVPSLKKLTGNNSLIDQFKKNPVKIVTDILGIKLDNQLIQAVIHENHICQGNPIECLLKHWPQSMHLFAAME